jgi:hypothetical protein
LHAIECSSAVVEDTWRMSLSEDYRASASFREHQPHYDQLRARFG